MGHYCYFCGEKLVGGYVPTCCENIESICTSCLNSFLNVHMSDELQSKIRTEILTMNSLSKETLDELSE